FFASNRGTTGVDKMYSATPVCGVEAIVMVRDSKTGAPLASAKVAILDEKSNVIETRTADAGGKVTYNIDCDRAYTIQASGQGSVGRSFPTAKTKGGIRNVNANLDPVEVIITQEVIVMNDSFFELNKGNSTKEAAFELDKAIEAMKKSPDMVVMVKAHTDNRGSDKYNMNLSNS